MGTCRCASYLRSAVTAGPCLCMSHRSSVNQLTDRIPSPAHDHAFSPAPVQCFSVISYPDKLVEVSQGDKLLCCLKCMN